LAQTAERGKFDLMFLADALAVRDGKLAALSRWPQYMVYFDPVTLLSAIAAARNIRSNLPRSAVCAKFA
jgi:alkanesulfonate monooxygenase